MRRIRIIAFAAALTVIASPAQPEVTLPSVLQILGSVTNAARPVANALIIALNLNNFEAIQTYSGADGSFVLPPLRNGIYKVIAVKHGFVPAAATVLPSGSENLRVTLRMQSEKQAKRSSSQEIWELRGSLPADILRELDLVMAAPQQAYEVPRIKGEMVSMTSVANAQTVAAFAQTGLGVQSRIGDTWQVGIRGDMQRIDDPTDSATFGGKTAAEAAIMEVELRSSPTNAYRVASTQTSWRYRDTNAPAAQAGLRSHNFEWEHGDARVKVRYFAHDNVFESVPGSDVIEIAGNTTILQTRRNDIGVSLRVRQESVRSSNLEALRTADVAATGSVELVPSFILQYGMASRLGADRSEWAPRTGFQWRLTKETSLVGSAEYKVLNNMPESATLPSLVVWSDDYQVLPRYSYSLGFVSSRNESNQLSAIATISAADTPLRVVFNDGFQQFWDGLYVDSGDIRRDIRLAYRRDFGRNFAVDVSTTAGTASPRQFSNDVRKVYVMGDLQTIFTPTGTTLAISYREIQQPKVEQRPDYHSTRFNVRMAQSLYLPIDVKLLLGLELARAENSPFLLDPMLSEETAKRYIGGLAVNF